jgi:IS5 family transposase
LPAGEGAEALCRRQGRPTTVRSGAEFKILVLQALYTLSDDQAEYQIRDRLTFMRFLGLGMGDRVPDAKTIWLFREHLTQAWAVDKLFARFNAVLEETGYFALSGQIIDASLIPAPRQRNDDEEKQAIKEGRIPEAWADNPAKLRQKDVDARWILKRGRVKPRADGKPSIEIAIPVFGYKNHIGTDRRYGLIRTWDVTDAATYDGRVFRQLLDKDNLASPVWADTAYRSNKNEAVMARNGFTSKVHFRKPPGKPLSEQRARANAARSKVRSLVEHVFAAQKHVMVLVVRTIGLARARTRIGMANLAYNMKRLAWLEGRTAPA